MISLRVKFTLILLYFLSGVCPSHGEVLQIDNNFDGKMDQWHHMSNHNKILKIEFQKTKKYWFEIDTKKDLFVASNFFKVEK